MKKGNMVKMICATVLFFCAAANAVSCFRIVNAMRYDEANENMTIESSADESSYIEEAVVYADIGTEKSLSVIREKTGVDLSEYAYIAEGIQKRSAYYIKVTLRDAGISGAEQAIVDVCGEGSAALLRKTPMFPGRIGEDFKEAERLAVYDYLRQGQNGAKTTSATFYTARSNGTMLVFVAMGI